ncbi:MAG: hypothetical protein FWE44_05340 [Defluviitaleaceae bacterium]|nr:hypothetical protein [Defluviitaleaceae bacterium]
MSKENNHPNPAPHSFPVVSTTEFMGIEVADPHLEKHLTDQMKKAKF